MIGNGGRLCVWCGIWCRYSIKNRNHKQPPPEKILSMLAVTNIALRDEREEQIGHKIRAMSTLTAAARRAKAELEVGGVMEESEDADERKRPR